MSEEIVAHYQQLSEQTGESLESIATRVESMDSPKLAAQLRALAGVAPAKAPKGRRAAASAPETAEAGTSETAEGATAPETAEA